MTAKWSPKRGVKRFAEMQKQYGPTHRLGYTCSGCQGDGSPAAPWHTKCKGMRRQVGYGPAREEGKL